jgi:protein-S-isoprenylcysteine O-methyltransferase Ste14
MDMESREQANQPSNVSLPIRSTIPQNPSTADLIRRPVVTYGAAIVLQAVALFAGAHRLNWPRGWLLVGLLIFIALSNVLVMACMNPRLLRQRFEEHTGAKPVDEMIVRLYLLVLLTFFYIAGLDAGRYEWSIVSACTILPGLVLSLLGHALVLWTMAENYHLEATVRIQEDHKVVTTGPYRLIRHPMYVGTLVTMAGWPLIVGSLWVYIPVASVAVLFVVRTALEDRTLQEELPGYREYCRQTRYRLVPGIW